MREGTLVHACTPLLRHAAACMQLLPDAEDISAWDEEVGNMRKNGYENPKGMGITCLLKFLLKKINLTF